MNEKKETLKKLLEQVPDTYEDFVHGVLLFAKTDKAIDGLIEFMSANPDANSSKVSICLEELLGY